MYIKALRIHGETGDVEKHNKSVGKQVMFRNIANSWENM
jgi:hypothetical protein